jgi:hypothetical protein
LSEKNVLTVDKAVEEFVNCARKNIYPLDKIAYSTMINVVNMMLVSLARKQNIELEEMVFPEEKNEKEENDINDIMKQVNEGTK